MLWVDSSRTRDSRKAGRKWFSVFSPLQQDGHLDPPCQGQRVSLLGELGGSQPGHHQLRQHRPCHAHRLPVRHHGGLDPDPLLGAFHKLFETIFSFRPIFIFVLLMSMSLSRLSGRNQISCQWVTIQPPTNHPTTHPTTNQPPTNHPTNRPTIRPFFTPTWNPPLGNLTQSWEALVVFFSTQ